LDVECIFRYKEKAHGQGLSYEEKESTQVLDILMLIEQEVQWTNTTIGYFVYRGGNIISRESLKQNVVA